MLNQVRHDFSTSAAIAGLVALLATYTGPVLIVVEAAKAGDLSQSLLSTWIFAVSMGAGVSGLFLSLRYRMPVIGAWSTPGVALLIFGLTQYSFSEAVACYLLLAILITIIGFSGLFSSLMRILPAHLLSAMIAGVLLSFTTQIFKSLETLPSVIVPVVVSYVFCKKLSPRYAVAVALLAGLLFAIPELNISENDLVLNIVNPSFTAPTFSTSSLLGLGLPLLLLALTQYATAIHILRNADYDIPPKSVVGVSGLVSIPLTFFGNSGANPAAIVGAICASDECHDDPSRRYISGVVCGLGYLVIGVFGSSVISLFSLLPSQLVTSLAGLALLGTLVSSLTTSLSEEKFRDASMITFIVTASGMSFWGLGSALWGLLFGVAYTTILQFRLRKEATEAETIHEN